MREKCSSNARFRMKREGVPSCAQSVALVLGRTLHELAESLGDRLG